MLKTIFSRIKEFQWIKFLLIILLLAGVGLVAFSLVQLIPFILDSSNIESDVLENGQNSFSIDPGNLSKGFEVGKIDTSSGAQQITIHIIPDDPSINDGVPVKISFLPDVYCQFGEGRACIYSISHSNENMLTFISVHSGLDAEAEEFREVLEGSESKQAVFTRDQVIQNIRLLIGSDVTVSQGDEHLLGLELCCLVRIPPDKVDVYMALPIEDTLEYAMQFTNLDPDKLNNTLFVFETCGWRLPGEEFVPGSPYTSHSIYLGFICQGENE